MQSKISWKGFVWKYTNQIFLLVWFRFDWFFLWQVLGNPHPSYHRDGDALFPENPHSLGLRSDQTEAILFRVHKTKQFQRTRRKIVIIKPLYKLDHYLAQLQLLWFLNNLKRNRVKLNGRNLYDSRALIWTNLVKIH